MPERQASSFLSVVVPAYNEQRLLMATLDSVTEYLDQQDYTWDVTVVDDGSSDETSAIVRDRSSTSSGVRLLQYLPNRGKGYAVRYGMQRVNGAWRLFMDADNSTSIEHLDEVLPLMDENWDIVIGSRRTTGARTVVHQPWWKETLGDLGGLWIRTIALPEILDSQAGFKIFRSDVVERIFPLLTLDRWAFDVELLAVARHFGYRIHEIPIQWFDDPHSKVTSASYLQALLDVVRVRRNLKRGVYDLPD
ncbi:MAG: dolichyl-phosphate beta-glucosyltransferase [Fuerstiella sp.]